MEAIRFGHDFRIVAERSSGEPTAASRAGPMLRLGWSHDAPRGPRRRDGARCRAGCPSQRTGWRMIVLSFSGAERRGSPR